MCALAVAEAKLNRTLKWPSEIEKSCLRTVLCRVKAANEQVNKGREWRKHRKSNDATFSTVMTRYFELIRQCNSVDSRLPDDCGHQLGTGAVIESSMSDHQMQHQ